MEKRFEVTVCSPTKINEASFSGGHVAYNIKVKSGDKQWEVIRRYSHFFAFREELKDRYKGFFIAPLPEKTILNRFNSEFIDYRRRELQRFLDRLLEHSFLSTRPELSHFLESENVNEKYVPKDQTSGLLSFLSESITVVNLAIKDEPDQWFDAKKNYIISLENQILAMSKAISSLVKKHKELADTFTELGVSATLLSSTEADHNAWLSTQFSHLSELSSTIASLQEKLVSSEMLEIEDSINDYSRILSAVKEMLSSRNDKLVLYQTQSKNLLLKKEKYEKQRNSKLEKEIIELDGKVEDLKNEFTTISDTCKNELQVFENLKSEKFQNLFKTFVQINMEIELQITNCWKLMLNKL